MAHELWIQAAAKPDPRPRPTAGDRYTEHHTHLPRGRAGAEAAERTRAARVIDRLAVQFGMADAIDELLAYVGVEHIDAMPDPAPGFPLLPQGDPDPAPPRRPRPARWRDAKECTLCRVVKPLDQFWRDRNHTDGHASRCKTCGRRRRNATTSKES